MSQLNHFVKVLQMFGRFAQEVEDKLLVFMLDEATKLEIRNQPGCGESLVNAFKLLADQQTKEVGFVVSGLRVDQDLMALPLQDQQDSYTLRRLEFILLDRLDEQDTEIFRNALLDEWIT